MEKLSARKKISIVKHYLSGLSYDETASRTGTSKGTISNVVADLKAGAFPEAADLGEQVEMLRELALDLRRSGLSPGQCAVGLAMLNRIKECGLDPAHIDRWPLILTAAGTEQDAKDFVQAVYRIQETELKSGLTLEQADEKLKGLEAKAAQLGPLAKQVELKKKELADLSRKREELAPVVNDLDRRYALLSPRVKDLEKREGELTRRIQEQQDMTGKANVTLAALNKQKELLQSAGFTLETLTEFNDRARGIAARHKLLVAQLRERLLRELETLDKGLGLETLVKNKEAELKLHQQAVASAKKEQAALRATISTLEQQKAALEASMRGTTENITYEIARIAPLAKAAISQIVLELQKGNKAATDDLQRLSDCALEIGKEIGRYEEAVKTSRWLMDLQSLVNGEDELKGDRLRVIVLVVLRGAHSWMKRNQTNVTLTLTYAVERLIGEVEQWRT